MERGLGLAFIPQFSSKFNFILILNTYLHECTFYVFSMYLLLSHSWGSNGLFCPVADWLCNIGFVLLAMLLSIEQNRQKTERNTQLKEEKQQLRDEGTTGGEWGYVSVYLPLS